MGKTTLGVDLITCQLLKDVQRCYAVCPTFWQQPQLERLRKVKGAFNKGRIRDGGTVFTTVSDNAFEYIFRKCSQDHIPTLLLVDDAAAESSTNKGNKGAFARLCIASPHLNLSIIAIFQKLSMCAPPLRDNSECLVQFQPTRRADVDMMVSEFNPYVARVKKEGDVEVRKLLERIWGEDTYCFAYRPARKGNVQYHVAFDELINL